MFQYFSKKKKVNGQLEHASFSLELSQVSEEKGTVNVFWKSKNFRFLGVWIVFCIAKKRKSFPPRAVHKRSALKREKKTMTLRVEVLKRDK